jgi:Flp pilus assembly secretin CpaC
MQKRFTVSAAAFAIGLAIWPAWGQREIRAGRESVDLELGTVTTIGVERPYSTVLIGDPGVIDFQTRDERSVALRPVGLGATNLVFVDEQGVVITNLTIVVRRAPPI